jgi:hypothetical protein
MKKPRWQAPGEHPDHNLILLFLDGELEQGDAVDIALHLKTCWNCRTYSEQIERGIRAFVEHRKESFFPALSPPPRRWSGFVPRLQGTVQFLDAHPSFCGFFEKLRLSTPWKALSRTMGLLAAGTPRPAWISGAVSVVAILALLRFSVVQPPEMQAAEFLRRVVAATRTLVRPGTVVSQRVRIRRGSAVFEQVLTHGAKVLTKTAEKTAPDAATKAAMALADMDVQAPLCAECFADWRDRFSQKDDRIFESQGSLTLRTTPLGDESSEVRFASLTVDRADWRPIAEHVEFRNQPALDVTEVSFEVHELPSVKAPGIQAPAAVAAPMTNSLQTELAVRYALHGVGAIWESPLRFEARQLPRSW